MLKKLSYFLEYLVFITFVRLFQFLGIQKTRKLTKVISLFVYYIIPLRKKIIRKNLQIAFPELKSNEINDLIKKIYFHNFLTFAELFLFEKLSEEQIKSIEKYSVVLPENTGTAAPTKTTTSAAPSSERTIKGSTTFKELINWGVKKEDIEKIINDKMPDSSGIIKDFAASKGIEFSIIKEPLQKLVDNLSPTSP